jgi:hypothetical protein
LRTGGYARDADKPVLRGAADMLALPHLAYMGGSVRDIHLGHSYVL